MNRTSQFLPFALLLTAAVWFSPESAHAQYRSNFSHPSVNLSNLNQVYYNQLFKGSLYGQAIYNPNQFYAQSQIARLNWAGAAFFNQSAYQNYSAAYGGFYGPYGGYGYGLGYGYGGYSPAYGSAYAGNPYTPAAPGYGVNPYSGGDPSQANPYSPYNTNPYYNNGGYGPGAVLSGQADVLRSFGSMVNSVEQARVVREQAMQAKLDTKKKEFDLDMYIKANTPTYTQEQEKIAKDTHRRILTNSMPGEISSGKSLNLLLKDLLKFRGKQSSLEPLLLTEPVLSHLNVTKTTYGIGILRDNGKVAFPGAIQDRMTPEQRRELEKQLQNLVKEANNNRVNAGELKDIRNTIDRIREDLVKSVNDVPTTQYMDGKRFLQELYEATRAIEQGEASSQANFQRFIESGRNGGRSIQEVVEYMGENALRFGPATASDEAAYRAAHTALATYDIAVTSQFGAE